jgi:hypothetical protein
VATSAYGSRRTTILARSRTTSARCPSSPSTSRKFTDGRGYSIGRLLRDRYAYRGELRAVGDVLRDQCSRLPNADSMRSHSRGDRDAAAACRLSGDLHEVYATTSRTPSRGFPATEGQQHPLKPHVPTVRRIARGSRGDILGSAARYDARPRCRSRCFSLLPLAQRDWLVACARRPRHLHRRATFSDGFRLRDAKARRPPPRC